MGGEGAERGGFFFSLSPLDPAGSRTWTRRDDAPRLLGSPAPPVFISWRHGWLPPCGPVQRLSEPSSSYWCSAKKRVVVREGGERKDTIQHKKEPVSRWPLERLFIAGVQC